MKIFFFRGERLFQVFYAPYLWLLIYRSWKLINLKNLNQSKCCLFMIEFLKNADLVFQQRGHKQLITRSQSQTSTKVSEFNSNVFLEIEFQDIFESAPNLWLSKCRSTSTFLPDRQIHFIFQFEIPRCRRLLY